jgi:hypothetical protein
MRLLAREPSTRINFAAINRAALRNASCICQWLLPGGRIVGGEYTALNPKRADRTPGSLKVNLRTGRWADFATDARGGDLIALVAWVLDVRQSEAARRLAARLCINPEA